MNELDSVTSSQQTRILGMSTLAFTVCFAVWTIFSIIGIQIKQDLGLSDTQFGLLVGTPILTGSLSRILLGIWTDQHGGRLVYFMTMILAAVDFPRNAGPGEVPADVIRDLGIAYVPVMMLVYMIALGFLTGYRISREVHVENVQQLAN